MTTLSFSAQVDDWVRATEARMTGVFRESAQRVVADAQMRVPVDTGFLRASIQASTSDMPLIDPMKKGGLGLAYEASQIALVIAGAEIGDTIFVGYTAAYAAFVEYGTDRMAGRGYVRLAAQRWPTIVAEVVTELKSRAGAH